jgi:hypothetical protein
MDSSRKFAMVFGSVAAVASAMFFAVAPASASAPSVNCQTPPQPGVTVTEHHDAGDAWTEAQITSNPCNVGVEAFIQSPSDGMVAGNDVKAVGDVSDTALVPEDSANHHGFRWWDVNEWFYFYKD